MSANEIKGLTNIVKDEVKKLNDRYRKAGTDLQNNTQRAHQIVTHIEDMNAEIDKSLDDLEAMFGQFSNMPPSGEKLDK